MTIKYHFWKFNIHVAFVENYIPTLATLQCFSIPLDWLTPYDTCRLLCKCICSQYFEIPTKVLKSSFCCSFSSFAQWNACSFIIFSWKGSLLGGSYIIWSISSWETRLRFALEINNCCCVRSCCYSLFRYNYFAFEHSPSYQEVQFLFLDAVESLNPNNISVSKLPLCVHCQFCPWVNWTKESSQKDPLKRPLFRTTGL